MHLLPLFFMVIIQVVNQLCFDRDNYQPAPEINASGRPVVLKCIFATSL